MLKNALWLFAVATIILLFFLPSFTIMQDHRQKNIEYERKIAGLEEKNKKLEEEKRLLREDPVYLEKVAREKMGLVREGETVLRLTPMNAEK
ncbi:MAG: septum formation initiator family protein [Candidatus Omnitrophica bacterium]|nr:septum formation initiator family protein [Candidatus Omnitrophota bacterium]